MCVDLWRIDGGHLAWGLQSLELGRKNARLMKNSLSIRRPWVESQTPRNLMVRMKYYVKCEIFQWWKIFSAPSVLIIHLTVSLLPFCLTLLLSLRWLCSLHLSLSLSVRLLLSPPVLPGVTRHEAGRRFNKDGGADRDGERWSGGWGGFEKHSLTFEFPAVTYFLKIQSKVK